MSQPELYCRGLEYDRPLELDDDHFLGKNIVKQVSLLNPEIARTVRDQKYRTHIFWFLVPPGYELEFTPKLVKKEE